MGLLLAIQRFINTELSHYGAIVDEIWHGTKILKKIVFGEVELLPSTIFAVSPVLL